MALTIGRHASSGYLKVGVSFIIFCVNFAYVLAEDVPVLEGRTLAIHVNVSVSQVNEHFLFVWMQSKQFHTEGGQPFGFKTLNGAEYKQIAAITKLQNIRVKDFIQSSLIIHPASQNEMANYWLEIYQSDDVYDDVYKEYLSISKIGTAITNQNFIHKSDIFYARVDNLPDRPKCVSNWTMTGSEINGKGSIKCLFDRAKPTPTATIYTGSKTIASTPFDYTSEAGNQYGLSATVEENDGPFRCELISSADSHFKESCEFDWKERATLSPPSTTKTRSPLSNGTPKAPKTDENNFTPWMIFIVACVLVILIALGICYYCENKSETEVETPTANGYHRPPTANGSPSRRPMGSEGVSPTIEAQLTPSPVVPLEELANCDHQNEIVNTSESEV